MNNSYAVYQPSLGWPLYVLQRSLTVRHFVLLEDVELSKAGLNRITVPTPQGGTHLTLPLSKAGSTTIIGHARPVDLWAWVDKTTKSLQNLYGRSAPWKDLYRDQWEDHWAHARAACPDHWTLSRLGGHLWQFLAAHIAGDAKPEMHYGSRLVPREQHDCPSTRLAEIGCAIKCKTYVSGRTAYDSYLQLTPFQMRGIDVAVQDWQMKPYPSLHGEQTDVRVSGFDLLFSRGAEEARKVLGIDKQ